MSVSFINLYPSTQSLLIYLLIFVYIQETSTGQWFKFSDAHVEKLQGRNTKLGSEVDPMSNGTIPNAGRINGFQHQINGTKRMVNGAAKFVKVSVTPYVGRNYYGHKMRALRRA